MQEDQKFRPQILLGLNVLLGIAAIFLLMQVRKEGVTGLLGYSSSRLAIILIEVIALLLFIGIAAYTLRDEHKAKSFSNWLASLPTAGNIGLAAVIFFLLTCLGLLWIALTGRWEGLGSIGVFMGKALPFLIWPGSIPLQLFVFHHMIRKSSWDRNTVLSLLVINLCVVFLLLDSLLRTNGFAARSLQRLTVTEILPDFAWIVFVVAVLFIVNIFINKISIISNDTYIFIRNGLVVFVTAVFLYMLSAMILGHYQTGEQAYSHELAAALLRGHAYIENPLSTVDLTFSNGHWFVPYPPLVAILMIPQVALFGAGNINTVSFSIVFAAINTALIFLILEQLRHLGWTKASLNSNIWLTAMFCLGTVHWYLSIWGEVWPLNQLTATTFVAIAVLLTLTGKPAWLAGISLGAAILARPHVGLTYPLLLGIYWNSLHPLSFSLQWKNLLRWVVASGIALSVIVSGILWYNNLRFGSPLDFGYDPSQINIGLFTDELLKYGQFNTRFILRNIQIMFFGLPGWNAQCGFFAPREIGMSILLTTPALVYMFRFQKLNPLLIGSWATVGLFLTVLLLHYSTGAMQFGYRFLLDLLTPVMILLSLALPNAKMPFTQKILILAGIVVNYWGLWWFFKHWCR